MKQRDNKTLIEHLRQNGILQTKRIIKAFLAIDRQYFVPPDLINKAYLDLPLPIGHGATISQPSTVAFMLELLQPKKGEQILDIGSGSGWTTALLAQLVGKNGQITGLEIIPELVVFGSDNLTKYNLPQAQILPGQKNVLGLPEQKFDKILVSASAKTLPQDLIKQLKSNGRLVIPIENSVYAIDKIPETQLEKKEFPGFEFVPLI